MARTNRKDFLHDETFDLIIINGDFLVGYSDENHLAAHLVLDKGHIRNNTELGCGILKETNGILDQRTRHNILGSLKKDGYNDVKITFNGDEIDIKI
jgi:hypothetical protein